MIVCLSLNAQTKDVEKQFYYGFDEKIEIRKVEKKVFIKIKPSVLKSQYEQSVKNRLGEIKTEWQGDNLCKID
jgi:hypothetical protein